MPSNRHTAGKLKFEDFTNQPFIWWPCKFLFRSKWTCHLSYLQFYCLWCLLDIVQKLYHPRWGRHKIRKWMENLIIIGYSPYLRLLSPLKILWFIFSFHITYKYSLSLLIYTMSVKNVKWYSNRSIISKLYIFKGSLISCFYFF